MFFSFIHALQSSKAFYVPNQGFNFSGFFAAAVPGSGDMQSLAALQLAYEEMSKVLPEDDESDSLFYIVMHHGEVISTVTNSEKITFTLAGTALSVAGRLAMTAANLNATCLVSEQAFDHWLEPVNTHDHQSHKLVFRKLGVVDLATDLPLQQASGVTGDDSIQIVAHEFDFYREHCDPLLFSKAIAYECDPQAESRVEQDSIVSLLQEALVSAPRDRLVSL